VRRRIFEHALRIEMHALFRGKVCEVDDRFVVDAERFAARCDDVHADCVGRSRA